MRFLSGIIYSYVITAVLLTCTIQAASWNESFEEDDDFAIQTTTIDNATAHQLAQPAHEKLLLWNSGNFISPRGAGNANGMVDMVLNQVKNIIRSQNLDRVKVPDFEKVIQKGIGIFKVKGKFRGYNGWLESLSSVSRKADATIRTEGTTVVLGSSLGLNTLQIGMDYEAKLGITKVKGKLDARVASNTVEFEAKVGYEAWKCVLQLRTLRVADLGKIKVKVTGLGPLNSLYSEIVTWLTGQFRNQIRDVIEKKARAFLEKNLSKLKCN